MTWLRIDDGFTEHGKILELARKDRWTWLEVLCYCARRQDDGRIPERIVDTLRYVTPGFLAACSGARLIDTDDAGRMTVHDWAVYNPKDPTKAERQARWRASRKDADVDDTNVYTPSTEPSTQASTETVPRARASAAAARPDPLREGRSSTEDRTSPEGDGGAALNGSAASADLSEWPGAEHFVRNEAWRLRNPDLAYRLITDYGVDDPDATEALIRLADQIREGNG